MESIGSFIMIKFKAVSLPCLKNIYEIRKQHPRNYRKYTIGKTE